MHDFLLVSSYWPANIKITIHDHNLMCMYHVQQLNTSTQHAACTKEKVVFIGFPHVNTGAKMLASETLSLLK